MQKPSTSSLLKQVLPPLAAGALVAAAAMFGASRFGLFEVSDGNGPSVNPIGEFVVFDMIRFVDAQRPLLASGGTENTMIFTRANAMLRETITEVAGPGVPVFVAQAIVSAEGQTRDITDEVIRRLGMEPPDKNSARAAHLMTPQGRALLEDEKARELEAEQSLGRARQGANESLIP